MIFNLIRSSRQSLQGRGDTLDQSDLLLAASMCWSRVPCESVMALIGTTDLTLSSRMTEAVQAPDVTHLECILRLWHAMLDQPDMDDMVFAYTVISQEFDARMEEYAVGPYQCPARVGALLGRLRSQLDLVSPIAFERRRKATSQSLRMFNQYFRIKRLLSPESKAGP
jgi:hypothetical protein